MKSIEKARIVVSRRSKAGRFACGRATGWLFAFVLCALLLLAAGCSQPGETMAEGHRRHLRNLSIDQQEMMQDIDMVLLTDQPSKLTDKRIQ